MDQSHNASVVCQSLSPVRPVTVSYKGGNKDLSFKSDFVYEVASMVLEDVSQVSKEMAGGFMVIVVAKYLLSYEQEIPAFTAKVSNNGPVVRSARVAAAVDGDFATLTFSAPEAPNGLEGVAIVRIESDAYPAPETDDCKAFEVDIDYQGNTISGGSLTSIASKEQCQEECLEAEQCKYFTFATDGTRRCWLKATKSGREQQKQRTSGCVVPGASTPEVVFNITYSSVLVTALSALVPPEGLAAGTCPMRVRVSIRFWR